MLDASSQLQLQPQKQLDGWISLYRVLSALLPDATKKLVSRAIASIGNSKESMCASWVGRLCIFNALAHVFMTLGQMRDKRRFKAADGKKKVAVFGVMNLKYVGILYIVLAVHIAGGTLSVIGSALSIYFEEMRPQLSRKIATVAAAGETFLHAPTALMLSPFVYGDKGVTPWVYMVTSLLLQLSGTSALIESVSDSAPGPNEELKWRRPELRRMSSTVGIFIYVRFYGLARGVGNYLKPQKYALAVVSAGLTMLPVGWAPCTFPATFWLLFGLNFKTVAKTALMIREHGVDRTAYLQSR